MYIGKNQKFGRTELFTLELNSTGDEGYNHPLTVKTRDEVQVGTLFLTKNANEDVTYIEWCEGNFVQGAGIKIELKELIGFMESKTP